MDLSFGFHGVGVSTPHPQNSATFPLPPSPLPLRHVQRTAISLRAFQLVQVHPSSMRKGRHVAVQLGSPVTCLVSGRAKAEVSSFPVIWCPHTRAWQAWPWPPPPLEVAPETGGGRRFLDLVKCSSSFFSSDWGQWIKNPILCRMLTMLWKSHKSKMQAFLALHSLIGVIEAVTWRQLNTMERSLDLGSLAVLWLWTSN